MVIDSYRRMWTALTLYFGQPVERRPMYRTGYLTLAFFNEPDRRAKEHLAKIIEKEKALAGERAESRR